MKSKEPKPNDVKQPGRLVTYNEGCCLICEKNHVTSLLISLRDKDIILCHHCATDLKKAIT